MPVDALEQTVALSQTSVEAVITTLKAQLGKPYKLSTEGPNTFDCSGLVWYCFNQNGLGTLIGGGRHRANWYYTYFEEKGLFVPGVAEAAQGDLIVYGNGDTATHIGIVTNPLRHKIISAIHPVVSRTGWAQLKTVDGQPLAIKGVCKVQWPNT